MRETIPRDQTICREDLSRNWQVLFPSRDVGGGKMTSHIKLYGSKGDRFEKIKEQLTEQLGYEPSNPEVVGMLMAGIDEEMDVAAGLTPKGRP